MITVPNQRTVTTNREVVPQGVMRPYSLCYIDNIQAAAQALNGGGFKLYMYLLTNADQYTQAFSPKAVASAMGMSENTVRDAWKELVAKNYIVANGKATFNFYETPAATTPGRNSDFCF